MGAVREAVEEVQAAEQRRVLTRALVYCLITHATDRGVGEAAARAVLHSIHSEGYVLVKASDLLNREVEYGPRGEARVKKLEARIRRALAVLLGEDE